MATTNKQQLTLISHKLCPYVQRAVIALEELGIEYKRIDIDLANLPDWFKRLSPLGKVPLLLIDDETVLFESAVIAAPRCRAGRMPDDVGREDFGEGPDVGARHRVPRAPRERCVGMSRHGSSSSASHPAARAIMHDAGAGGWACRRRKAASPRLARFSYLLA